jgi:hypothetical protein
LLVAGQVGKPLSAVQNLLNVVCLHGFIVMSPFVLLN